MSFATRSRTVRSVGLAVFLCLALSVYAVRRRSHSPAARQSPSGGRNQNAQQRSPPEDPLRSIPIDDSDPMAWMITPGISAPPLRTPDEVDLADTDQVIGIVVGDEARAYVVEAFAVHGSFHPRDLAVHVVNDTVGGRPVCVTHCNRTDMTRVLTEVSVRTDPSAEPLDLQVGGFSKGLLLRYNGVRYHQEDARIPLQDLQFIVTTWKDWYTEHPGTLVYTGNTGRG